MKNWVLGILFGFLVVGCVEFKKKNKKIPVARVNTSYLYQGDLEGKVHKGASQEDSTSIVNTYIKNWATERLLIDQAQLNLKQTELRGFDELVEDYRSTLYINAYQEAVVSKSINLEITDKEIQTFYEENLENFNLNQDLLKFRYLHLPAKYGSLYATQTKLDRFNKGDKENLKNRSQEFIEAFLNDSIWYTYNDMYNKIPMLQASRKQHDFIDGDLLRHKDSLGNYLLKINKVLKKGQVSPIEYVKSTIRHIILNKRKKEIIKKLEKDITKDAIKNKQFEIYN